MGSTSRINFRLGTNRTLKKEWKLSVHAQVCENPNTQIVKKKSSLKETQLKRKEIQNGLIWVYSYSHNKLTLERSVQGDSDPGVGQ